MWLKVKPHFAELHYSSPAQWSIACQSNFDNATSPLTLIQLQKQIYKIDLQVLYDYYSALIIKTSLVNEYIASMEWVFFTQ